MLDTDPNIIFVKDWNGQYLLANQAAAQFYNMTVDDLVGKYDRDFDSDQTAVEQSLAENRHVIETGEGILIPEEKISLNGCDEWLQWQKRPLRLPGSSNYSVLGIGVRITKRKQLEEELRQSQQFLNSIINNIPLALFAKDVQDEFRYVLINNHSEKVLAFRMIGVLVILTMNSFPSTGRLSSSGRFNGHSARHTARVAGTLDWRWT